MPMSHAADPEISASAQCDASCGLSKRVVGVGGIKVFRCLRCTQTTCRAFASALGILFLASVDAQATGTGETWASSLKPGQAVILDLSGLESLVFEKPGEWFGLLVEGADGIRLKDELRFASPFRIDQTAAGRFFANQIRLCATSLHPLPDVSGLNAPLEQALGTMLLSALCAASRAASGEAAPATRISSASAQHFERATRFMAANMKRKVGTEDIAASIGIGERMLQLVFRREAGQTPLSYLRMLRLHSARRDILASAGTGGLCRVARRYHLGSAGAFARHYFSAFGELPKETLLRRCPTDPSVTDTGLTDVRHT